MNHRTPTTSTARRLLGVALAGLVALGATSTAHAGDRAPAPPKPAPIGAGSGPIAPAPIAPAPTPPAPKPTPAGPQQLAGLSASGFTLTGVTAKAHGTWARFAYTTNAADVTVRVSDRQPVFKNGVWSEPYLDGIVGPETVHTTKPGTVMKYNWYYLQPGTTYHYIVTVPTKPGQVPVQAVGSFTTLRRTLTITWDTIHVTDDSDPGAKGAGDFTFWFRVNGTQIARIHKDIKSDSSYTITVNGEPLTTVLPNLTKDVPFSVQVFEDDIQSWDTCGHELLSGDNWDGTPIDKETECGTWLAMEDFYDASPGNYRVGYGWREGEPIEFTMSPWDSSVHLTITGTITAVWA